MSLLQNSNAISSGLYTIDNSLRFRKSASAYLNRTFSSPTNGKIWTLSIWLKRGALSSIQAIMTAQSGGSEDSFAFLAADTIRLYFSAYSSAGLITNAVFRDPSAWYHIVLAIDTTQATASNRVKLYVNGTQQTFSGSDYPAQNATPYFNTALTHYIAYYANNASYTFDGYNAETYFIDGSAKTPSDFGETDTTTGVWKPKAYTGTYGTNGFYLKFSNIALTSGSNTGLGKDFSGNGNYWNTNNISVTSGTTYDAMIDSPTNASASGTQPVGNYAVMNPLQKSTGVTVSDANLGLTTGGGSPPAKILSTIGMSSGKWYCEMTMMSGSSNGNYGLATASTSLGGTTYLGDDAYSWCYAVNGNKYTSGSGVAYGATYTVGDVIGVAFDADAGTLTYYKNGTSQGTAYTGLTSGPYFFAQGAASSIAAVNFGQRPFAYSVPSGYKALCTTNLPDSTIIQGNKYMDATLYTGNSTTGRTISTNFYADFIWTKARNVAYSHSLFDSVRGAGQSKNLVSNSTEAEGGGNSVYGNVSAFGSSAYTLAAGTDGGNPYANNNESGKTYVGWLWNAGSGSTSSGTGTGGITSVTQSVNTTAGFSIVTYTGSGANGTVTHGLGVAPKMLIVKKRSAAGTAWMTWHTAFTGLQYVDLSSTAAVASFAGAWNSTTPTSSVFSVGTLSDTNASGATFVAYVFAEIAGFSKFGSYVGNGSADGPFVYLGFRPKFVLLFDSTNGNNWYILDSARDTYNATGLYLFPNTSGAENDLRSTYPQDFLSNGFKIRNASFPNSNNSKVIYMAFAENPFGVNCRAR